MQEEPDAIVLYRKEAMLTRMELLTKANQFAVYLKSRGIKKEEIVCIVADRSFELVACVLGILQAGGAFLLFSTDMPEWRMKYILNETMPRFIFKQKEFIVDFNGIQLEDIYDGQSQMKLECKRETNQLAYLAYTSGSTGMPQGVMVEDSNVLCYCSSYAKYFSISHNDIIVQASPINFDGFIEEIFVSLLYGASIVIPEKHEVKHPKLINDLICYYNATVYATTPLMINELNKLNYMPSLRVLISAGDTLKKKYYNYLINKVSLYNMYGPTETTVCATCFKCSQYDEEYTPVGKPLNDYSIEIIDDKGVFVENGKKGEILIGGNGVSRGYWKNEQLTRERFVFINGKKFYRSGDYGFVDEQGNIHIENRIDRQVKINGFRVELKEIESAIVSKDGVQDAVAFTVVIDEERILSAAYVMLENKVSSASDMVPYLKNYIPGYMVPKYIFQLEAIPVTEFGKIDYTCLEKIVIENRGQLVNNVGVEDEPGFSRFLEIVNKTENNLSKEDLISEWDSISFIRIMVDLENEYDITFDDEYLIKERYDNLGNLYELVMEICNNSMGK